MPKRLTDDQILEIVNLAKMGISIANISKKLGLKETTVYYHARNHCRKMTKLDPNLLSEFEKGYIIGFFLGDGNIDRGRKTQRYFVRFFLDTRRDRDICMYLCSIFQKGRKRVSILTGKAVITLKICSKELVDFILKYVEYKRDIDNRLEKRLNPSRNWPIELQYGILSGIIDSDGYVHEHLGTQIKTVSSSFQRRIRNMLTYLRINATFREEDATRNSFSKRSRYVIYIPSAEMNANRDKLHSVKIKRYLGFHR